MIPSHAAQGCKARPKKLGDAVMKAFLARFAQDDSGATAIEYGLIGALISVGIVGGLTQLRGGLTALFGDVNTELGNAVP
jgi:pilus assembly protein Flp/PilA